MYHILFNTPIDLLRRVFWTTSLNVPYNHRQRKNQILLFLRLKLPRSLVYQVCRGQSNHVYTILNNNLRCLCLLTINFLFLGDPYKNVKIMLSDLELSHLLEKFHDNLIRVGTVHPDECKYILVMMICNNCGLLYSRTLFFVLRRTSSKIHFRFYKIM